jgi:DNA-directed RNA polymerase specialized sigma24 family protein
MPPSEHAVTRLLREWRDGDQAAFQKLMPLVYDELHRLAHGYMRRERPGHTLETTAVVKEAFLRRVEELRYFGGLNNREVAEVLGVSDVTIERDWRFARAWLYRELQPS